MQSKTTIYHEFSKQLPDSDRAEIIRNGWGSTTPVAPVAGRTGTKVQVLELSAAEFADWAAAKRNAAANLWNFTFPARGGR